MGIALLSQEGSGIAKRIPRGVVPKPKYLQLVALEPPRRFAPPLLTQEGSCIAWLNLFDRMSNVESPKSPSTRITHFWIPVLLMLMIQYTFSTGAFSTAETSKFIVPLLKFLIRNPSKGQLLFWHHVIRKAAHVTEYCILGILVYRAFKIDMPKPALVSIFTMIFVAAAALIDEYHQWFVPSRGSSIVDVGWDCIGGLMAITLLWIWRSSRAVEE